MNRYSGRQFLSSSRTKVILAQRQPGHYLINKFTRQVIEGPSELVSLNASLRRKIAKLSRGARSPFAVVTWSGNGSVTKQPVKAAKKCKKPIKASNTPWSADVARKPNGSMQYRIQSMTEHLADVNDALNEADESVIPSRSDPDYRKFTAGLSKVAGLIKQVKSVWHQGPAAVPKLTEILPEIQTAITSVLSSAPDWIRDIKTSASNTIRSDLMYYVRSGAVGILEDLKRDPFFQPYKKTAVRMVTPDGVRELVSELRDKFGQEDIHASEPKGLVVTVLYDQGSNIISPAAILKIAQEIEPGAKTTAPYLEVRSLSNVSAGGVSIQSAVQYWQAKGYTIDPMSGRAVKGVWCYSVRFPGGATKLVEAKTIEKAMKKKAVSLSTDSTYGQKQQAKISVQHWQNKVAAAQSAVAVTKKHLAALTKPHQIKATKAVLKQQLAALKDAQANLKKAQSSPHLEASVAASASQTLKVSFMQSMQPTQDAKSFASAVNSAYGEFANAKASSGRADGLVIIQFDPSKVTKEDLMSLAQSKSKKAVSASASVAVSAGVPYTPDEIAPWVQAAMKLTKKTLDSLAQSEAAGAMKAIKSGNKQAAISAVSATIRAHKTRSTDKNFSDGDGRTLSKSAASAWTEVLNMLKTASMSNVSASKDKGVTVERLDNDGEGNPGTAWVVRGQGPLVESNDPEMISRHLKTKYGVNMSPVQLKALPTGKQWGASLATKPKMGDRLKLKNGKTVVVVLTSGWPNVIKVVDITPPLGGSRPPFDIQPGEVNETVGTGAQRTPFDDGSTGEAKSTPRMRTQGLSSVSAAGARSTLRLNFSSYEDQQAFFQALYAQGVDHTDINTDRLGRFKTVSITADPDVLNQVKSLARQRDIEVVRMSNVSAAKVPANVKQAVKLSNDAYEASKDFKKYNMTIGGDRDGSWGARLSAEAKSSANLFSRGPSAVWLDAAIKEHKAAVTEYQNRQIAELADMHQKALTAWEGVKSTWTPPVKAMSNVSAAAGGPDTDEADLAIARKDLAKVVSAVQSGTPINSVPLHWLISACAAIDNDAAAGWTWGKQTRQSIVKHVKDYLKTKGLSNVSAAAGGPDTDEADLAIARKDLAKVVSAVQSGTPINSVPLHWLISACAAIDNDAAAGWTWGKQTRQSIVKHVKDYLKTKGLSNVSAAAGDSLKYMFPTPDAAQQFIDAVSSKISSDLKSGTRGAAAVVMAPGPHAADIADLARKLQGKPVSLSFTSVAASGQDAATSTLVKQMQKAAFDENSANMQKLIAALEKHLYYDKGKVSDDDARKLSTLANNTALKIKIPDDMVNLGDIVTDVGRGRFAMSNVQASSSHMYKVFINNGFGGFWMPQYDSLGKDAVIKLLEEKNQPHLGRLINKLKATELQASAQRNSTQDSKGQDIEEGQTVVISKQYGGGSGKVKSVSNGFIVVDVKGRGSESFSSSDVTIKMSVPTDLLVNNAARRAGETVSAAKEFDPFRNDAADSGVQSDFTNTGAVTFKTPASAKALVKLIKSKWAGGDDEFYPVARGNIVSVPYDGDIEDSKFKQMLVTAANQIEPGAGASVKLKY